MRKPLDVQTVGSQIRPSESLDPAEHAAEQQQTDPVEGEDRADGDGLAPPGLHVVHPEGHDEEMEVAEDHDGNRGTQVPPPVVPSQRVDGVELLKRLVKIADAVKEAA